MELTYNGEQRVPNISLNNKDLAGLVNGNLKISIESPRGHSFDLTLTMDDNPNSHAIPIGIRQYKYSLRGKEDALRTQKVLPVQIDNFYVYLNFGKQ